MLTIQHLSYTFPKQTKPLFQDLTVSLASPGINFLIGHNGAGKTTLADILTGLRPAVYQGTALPRAIYLNQSLPVLASVRVRDVAKLVLGIEYGQRRLSLTDLRERADAATVAFLTPLWSRRYQELSGGQRKLVQLLLFLQVNRELIVLDEPTAAVDRENVQRLFVVMRAHPQRTYLMITHDVRDIRAFTDYRVLWLNQGKVTPLTPTQFVENAQRAAFLTAFQRD